MSPVTAYVVETFVTLLGVVTIAVLVLVAARRLGIGRPLGPMELVGRLPVDARRSVLLVRVADQVLILGVSEAGITRLGDLPASSVPVAAATPAKFADVLARLKSPAPRSSPPVEPAEDSPE